MPLILLLLLNFYMPCVFAAETTVVAEHEIPVYAGTSEQGRPSLFLRSGESLVVLEKVGTFRRVKILRSGKLRVGYVKEAEVADLLNAKNSPHTKRRWGVGPGMSYNHLSQNGRNFEAEDQVKYTTSAYVSQTISPSLSLQLFDRDFWRVSFGYKTSHYIAQVVTDSGGGATKPIEVNHRFLSGMIQKAFNPLPWKFIYAGVGLEFAKATSVEILLDGKPLAVSDQEKPAYFGIQGFAGMQFFLLPRLSISAEGRMAIVPNQVPTIYEYGFGVCLLYWL